MAQVKAGRPKAARLTVRMLITCHAPNLRCRPGDLVETDLATAKGWLDAGEAEPVARKVTDGAETR
jgi:hypothetical protein